MTVNSGQLIFIAAWLLVSYTQVQEVIAQGNVPQQCLQCICQAASGCDTLTGCKGEVCGPYRITEPYWCDSGKPGNDGNSADGGFGKCVGDPSCAAQAVQGYMARFAHDCNGDGVVDCDDYIRIHRLGPEACSDNLPQEYQNAYTTCMSGGGAQLDVRGMQPAGYGQPNGWMQAAGGVQPGGGMQPIGGVQSGGGMQPIGGVQSGGGMQPIGGVQRGGGMQPIGGVQSGGGMQPIGGIQSGGGMQPIGGIQSGGGMQPIGGVQSGGGMQPIGGVQPGGGMQPAGYGQPNGWMQAAGGNQPGLGMQPTGGVQPGVGMQRPIQRSSCG